VIHDFESQATDLLNSASEDREGSGAFNLDGSSIWFGSGQAVQKASVDGGPTETVLETTSQTVHWLRCARGSEPRCVMGYVDGDEYVFAALAPDQEGDRELLRILHRAPFTKWDLSPDGTKVAVVHNDDDSIRIIDLESGEEAVLKVKGESGFEYVAWTSDGQGFYVNAGFAIAQGYPKLIHVDMEGNASLIRQRPNEWHVFPEPSPDGRYLAFASMPIHGNAWLIRGF
jgi:hypothetical protein